MAHSTGGVEFSPNQMQQLAGLFAQATSSLATKSDLSSLATKSDLKDLEAKVDAIDGRLGSVENRLGSLEKRMCSLEKTWGILVEEKARMLVAREFGEDFSRRFTIKSVHDVAKVLSKAGAKELRKDDIEARIKVAEKIVEPLKALLPSFGKVAVEAVNTALEENASAFENDAFKKAKSTFQKDAIHFINDKNGKELEELDWKKIYGVTLNLVNTLSEELEGEDSAAFKNRVKVMSGRFKRKLERLKVTVEKNTLLSCNSAGIMLLAALAHAKKDVWEKGEEAMREWIEKQCNVFELKEEVKCDLMPSLSVVGNFATIMVGEIKSSIEEYGKAKDQMLYTAEVLQLALWFGIGKGFETVIKKGHLYVLEVSQDDQRLSAELHDDISIFVHPTPS